MATLSSLVIVDPAEIRFKISPHHDLDALDGSDWDITRRYCLEKVVKHRAIRQRFKDGAKWEDTDLFRVTYARRFAEGDDIRGCSTMQQLLNQYYTRVDDLFKSLKVRGFDKRHPLPVLLIGRTGEVFIGNQGNHRLAMAQVLGLTKFAGKVICRHST